jgi:RecB family exonuclease
MAFNPNAVFISPSSLSDFDKCPQLYYFRNVYRSPRGLKIQIISPSLALGQAVHDVLSQFLRLSPAQRSKDELLRVFDFLWQSLSGEKGGFGSQEEEKSFKERALSMLERFWGNKHFQETEAVQIPGFPKVELGNDLILTGKLDWIEKDGEGYHVIDFKTGKNEEREDSQQLPIYSVLVSGILGSKKIRTSYWYLDKDDEIVAFPSADLDKTLSELKRKGEIVKMVRQTNSFRCQSGEESCWACREMLAVAQGKGKLVSMDPVNRKQEIYILSKETVVAEKTVLTTPATVVEDLPF